jgi:hypothetical protein
LLGYEKVLVDGIDPMQVGGVQGVCHDPETARFQVDGSHGHCCDGFRF